MNNKIPTNNNNNNDDDDVVEEARAKVDGVIPVDVVSKSSTMDPKQNKFEDVEAASTSVGIHSNNLFQVKNNDDDDVNDHDNDHDDNNDKFGDIGTPDLISRLNNVKDDDDGNNKNSEANENATAPVVEGEDDDDDEDDGNDDDKNKNSKAVKKDNDDDDDNNEKAASAAPAAEVTESAEGAVVAAGAAAGAAAAAAVVAIVPQAPAEGEAKNEDDLTLKITEIMEGLETTLKITEIMEGLETTSNFRSFDVQTWLIGEAITDINSDHPWILKQLLCLIGILILFFIRSTIFVLIGIGAGCPQWVTNTGIMNKTNGYEAMNTPWMEENKYKEFYEDGTPTGWRTKFIALFSVSIVALRFMTDIVKDMDMAVLGIECLRQVKVEYKPKTPFIILLLQCAFVARRLLIPLLASIAVVTSIRQNDKTKISYGELYSNPIDIFLQSLAVIFVLEVDEHITSLFVSAKKETKIKKDLDKLLNKSVASQADVDAIATQSFFDRPFKESFEIYIWDLNLLNRFIGLICIILFLVGYFGSLELMILPSYNTFNSGVLDAVHVRWRTRNSTWEYCAFYMSHIAIPMGIIGWFSIIFLNFFFILNFCFCGRRIMNRTPFVDSCVTVSGAALGGLVICVAYLFIGIGFENLIGHSDDKLRKVCWIIPPVGLFLVSVPMIVMFFH